MGLQIHGRPVARLQADFEEYAEKGITVNSEFVLAVGYCPIKTKSKKSTMLFVPLIHLIGHIFVTSKVSGKWISTGLVLMAKIEDDGRAKNLYLILPPRCHDDNGSEAYIRPAAVSERESDELRKFQGDLPFTVARLEGGFALLQTDSSSLD